MYGVLEKFVDNLFPFFRLTRTVSPSSGDRGAYLKVGEGAENRVCTNFVRSAQVYALTVICMQSNYRTI